MTDGQLGDLVIFVGIVGVVVVVGIAMGMIVAGRIDRLMASRPDATDAADATDQPAADDGPFPAPDEETNQ